MRVGWGLVQVEWQSLHGRSSADASKQGGEFQDIQPATGSSSDGSLLAAPRTGVQTLVLYLIAFSALTTLVSWRYHFAVSHYGRFILDQVLPASGISERIRVAWNREIPALDDLTLADLGNPYFPQYHPQYVYQPNKYQHINIRQTLFGSDYLIQWHYAREIINQRDPYIESIDFIYNSTDNNSRSMSNPRVPEQIVSPLNYFPAGDFWQCRFIMKTTFYHS